MPLYEYHCDRCGETFEVRQKFSDQRLTVHAGCGGEVKRLLSVPTFQFKGTGFYVTDYARGKKPSAGGNGSAAKTEGKPEPKPEPKPDSKTESKPAPAPKSSD